MSEPTATIPVENLPLLREKLAFLNKKAEKLGTPPITLRTGETKMADDPVDHPGEVYEFIEVFVEGEAPKLNGWVFVATLEHDENGTIIRRIPTFTEEIDLSQYRTATPDNCDQCGYKRRRNDTYIVARSEADRISGPHLAYAGPPWETKQVGSNCLKDFTGHENPQAVARFMELVRDFIESVEGGSFDGGRLTPRYSLGGVLDVAADQIAKGGYISYRRAEETDEIPTAQAVRNEFFARLRMPSYQLTPLDANVDVDKVIEWVRGLSDEDLENDYLYNLYTVFKSGTITDRQFGIAASGIAAYQRAMQREQERKSQRVDEYLADEKAKVTVEFTVLRVFENNTEYGISYKHILRASTGHTLTWRTNSAPLEQGKTYTAIFSVKGHYESKYGKETQIWRPKDLQEV